MKTTFTALLLLLLSFSASAQRPLWVVDTTKIHWINEFDFEQGVLVDTASVWQIGQPGKTYLNSPYAGSRALMTDTAKLISGKRKDSFRLKFSVYNDFFCGNFHVAFRHRFDFDSLSGGVLRISTDNGKSFSNVWSDTGYFGVCWWHDQLYPKNSLIFNGEPGFKGKSADWMYTQVNITFYILVKTSDTLILSFDYESDSLSLPHEGWEIDEIRTGGELRSGGIGDHAFQNDFAVYPNPTQHQLNIEPLSDIAASISRYRMRSAAGLMIKEGTLAPQQTNTIQMEDLAKGIYFLEIESSDGAIAVRKVLLD